MIDDYTNFINKTKDLYDSNLPRFLFGYSLGGQLSITLSIQMEGYFNGLVLFAPAVNTDAAMKNDKRAQRWIFYTQSILKFVARFWPKLKIIQSRGKI